MLKTDVRSAQEMFEELGYKKDEDSSHEIPTYKNECRSLMITEAGVVIVSTPISLSSLTTKEIEAIYKQIKELEQC